MSAARVIVEERVAECLVAEKAAVAEDVVALTLVDPGGGELPGWTPGAHVDLVLTESLTRQYSLCGSVAEAGTWRVAILREPEGRGGSAHVHDELEPGSTVRVRGPRNHFRLVDSRRYLFIAGGIGITPILPMIAAAEQSGREWKLLYGGRRRGSMAFLDELEAYGDRVTVWPQDEHGLLDLGAELAAPWDDTLVYCCGPEPLLAAVERSCAGWPPESLRVERFAARPGALAAGPDAVDSFEVVLERSGVTLTVPAGKSILQACEEAGVSVLSSCREGICATCETDVLEGTPDHRDSVLSASERESGELMMICVSRSLGPRLVLDL
jgi:ferredoxin-NADP reductase